MNKFSTMVWIVLIVFLTFLLGTSCVIPVFLGNDCRDTHLSENGLECRNCPAGTYVHRSCEQQNGSSNCYPCLPGHYQPFCSSAKSCEPCNDCRKYGAIVKVWCTPQNPTQCVCPNGKYFKKETQLEGLCLDHTVCKPDETEIEKGTPLKDTVCNKTTAEDSTPVTTNSEGTDTAPDRHSAIWIVVGVLFAGAVLFGGLAILLVLCWKGLFCFKKCGRGGRGTKDTEQRDFHQLALNQTPTEPIVRQETEVSRVEDGDSSTASPDTAVKYPMPPNSRPQDSQPSCPQLVAQDTKAVYRNLESLNESLECCGVQPVPPV